MKHFNPDVTTTEPQELQAITYYMQHLQQIPYDCIDKEPPNIEEIREVLEKLKSGKSANDIPPELLKYATNSNELLLELRRLLLMIWKEKQTPRSWSHSKLIALWKGAAKGSNKDPNAYRGLQVGPTLFTKL